MSQVAAQVHEFTVTLAGAVELTVAVADAVYKPVAGCLTLERGADPLSDVSSRGGITRRRRHVGHPRRRKSRVQRSLALTSNRIFRFA